MKALLIKQPLNDYGFVFPRNMLESNSMCTVIIAATVPVLALTSAPTFASHIRVYDGDTIVIDNVRTRLWGIDAHEKRQKCYSLTGKAWKCGLKAKEMLVSLINQNDLSCNQIDWNTKNDRPVSICYSGGVNLNQKMVQLGQVKSDVRFTSDYLPDEQKARSLKIGMWAGSTIYPEICRKMENKQLFDPMPDPTCPIKGNISRHDNKIAHVPSGRYYSKTSIDTGKGERWFCSTGEALAAGWQLVR